MWAMSAFSCSFATTFKPRGTDSRIESVGCNLVTLRDSKIARIDFYPSREQGLEAAGLRE
jgi:hypothetical protein